MGFFVRSIGAFRASLGAALLLAVAASSAAASPTGNVQREVIAVYTADPDTDNMAALINGSNCESCHNGAQRRRGDPRDPAEREKFTNYGNAFLDELESISGSFATDPSTQRIESEDPDFLDDLRKAARAIDDNFRSVPEASGGTLEAGTTAVDVRMVQAIQPFDGKPGLTVAPATPLSVTFDGDPRERPSGVQFTVQLPPRADQINDRLAGSQPYTVGIFGTNTAGLGTLADSPSTFDVSTRNAAPAADPDTFFLGDEVNDGPVLLDVLGTSPNLSDRDPDDPDDPAELTYPDPSPSLSEGGDDSDAGSVRLVERGVYEFRPSPGVQDDTETRELTFEYRVRDREDAFSERAMVTIRIAPRNIPEREFDAVDDVFRIEEGSRLENASVGDNDDLDGADINDDPPEVQFIAESILPEQGSLDFDTDTGEFVFIPPADFSGEVSFGYTLTNGKSSDTAQVRIQVQRANDLPTAEAIVLPKVDDTSDPVQVDLVGSEWGVSDKDGDQLSVVGFDPSRDVEITGVTGVSVDELVSLDGTILTIRPQAVRKIEDGERVTVTVTYQISDGGNDGLVTNTLTQVIDGLDNGLAQPGAYADTLHAKYNGHFGQQSDGNSACLACHNVGQVGVDIDDFDDCNDTIFNAYGLALCRAREPGQPLLSSLGERLAEVEPRFAPTLQTPAETVLTISEDTPVDDPIGLPLEVDFPGRNIQGELSDVVGYLLEVNGQGKPDEIDPSRNFMIDDEGQIRVASRLEPGVYELDVLPVNDAGQLDAQGRPVDKPGFFLTDDDEQTTVTIIVERAPPEARSDTVNTAEGRAVRIPVTENDRGGDPTSVAVEDPPANGTATVSGLEIRYAPAAGFTGTDEFTYTASNDVGSSDPARVTVTVVASGGLVAVDDAVTTTIGYPISIDVLANDDGAILTGGRATEVSIASGPDPEKGTLDVEGQTLVFTPADGFDGQARFSYFASNPGVAGVSGSAAEVVVRVVEVGNGSIVDAVLDPELRLVASAFENTCAIVSNDGGDADFLAHCANLTLAAINGEDLEQAMRALRNEEHLAVVDLTMTVARSLGEGVFDRLSRVRGGAPRGFDLDGVNLSIGETAVPSDFVMALTEAIAGAGRDGFSTDDIPWGVFISGAFTLAEKDPGHLSGGYDLDANDVLLGVDYQLDAERIVGGALGYSEALSSFEDGGSIDGRGLQATLYGSDARFMGTSLGLDGFLSFGQIRIESERAIRFDANNVPVDTVANAEFNAHYFNLAGLLSYTERLGRYGDPMGDLQTGVDVTWEVGVDYLKTFVEGYEETGGDGLALAVDDSDYNSLIVNAGVDLSRPVWLGQELDAEVWAGFDLSAELLDETRSVTSRFLAGGPGAPRFVVTEPGSQGWGGGVELGGAISGGWGTLDLGYSHRVNAGDLTVQRFEMAYSREFGRRTQLQLGFAMEPGSEGRPNVDGGAGVSFTW